LLVVVLVAGAAFTGEKGNTTIQSFNKAKRILQRQIYPDRAITFYCGCRFTPDRKISHRNGYVPKRNSRRADRIEWEHVVPAHAFGRSFTEWRLGHPECLDRKGRPFKGRNCARKKAEAFRYMESDLYNLVPAVGEINGLRSNYSFAIIAGEKREFGICDMEIEARKAEPPPQIRGDIARTYKYMDWAYPGRGVISGKNRKLFDAWDRQDPVDAWECERAGRIERIQGNVNPFVKEMCSGVYRLGRIGG
jgi:deoxyribonuclease-1